MLIYRYKVSEGHQLKELYKNIQKRNTTLEDALAKTSWDINPMDAIIATINTGTGTCSILPHFVLSDEL